MFAEMDDMTTELAESLQAAMEGSRISISRLPCMLQFQAPCALVVGRSAGGRLERRLLWVVLHTLGCTRATSRHRQMPKPAQKAN